MLPFEGLPCHTFDVFIMPCLVFEVLSFVDDTFFNFGFCNNYNSNMHFELPRCHPYCKFFSFSIAYKPFDAKKPTNLLIVVGLLPHM